MSHHAHHSYASRRTGRQVRRNVTRDTKSGGAVAASQEEDVLSPGCALTGCLFVASPFILLFIAIMIFLIASLAQRCG